MHCKKELKRQRHGDGSFKQEQLQGAQTAHTFQRSSTGLHLPSDADKSFCGCTHAQGTNRAPHGPRLRRPSVQKLGRQRQKVSGAGRTCARARSRLRNHCKTGDARSAATPGSPPRPTGRVPTQVSCARGSGARRHEGPHHGPATVPGLLRATQALWPRPAGHSSRPSGGNLSPRGGCCCPLSPAPLRRVPCGGHPVSPSEGDPKGGTIQTWVKPRVGWKKGSKSGQGEENEIGVGGDVKNGHGEAPTEGVRGNESLRGERVTEGGTHSGGMGTSGVEGCYGEGRHGGEEGPGRGSSRCPGRAGRGAGDPTRDRPWDRGHRPPPQHSTAHTPPHPPCTASTARAEKQRQSRSSSAM